MTESGSKVEALGHFQQETGPDVEPELELKRRGQDHDVLLFGRGGW